ncbi:MAG: VOC family protein [Alphaproteobacteria bacterium]|jgi:methylmalonyl-CoA epimerase|nr:VOC family protein [Alphaproteobacteria bacterium]MDP6566328.1 VOC family protein [Alphaproteobacteria bacterium]MDP6815419.1 VOC family protein [Alphaproteobacteria bacterium]
MYKWIDHIVVRVKDLDQGLRDYQDKLGLAASKEPEERADLGMRRAILPLGDSGRFIELAEPMGEDSAIGRSLERQGEGLHLVALAVDDVAAAAAEMKGNGARLIETGNMVFVHPADGHGVLYQLIERK